METVQEYTAKVKKVGSGLSFNFPKKNREAMNAKAGDILAVRVERLVSQKEVQHENTTVENN